MVLENLFCSFIFLPVHPSTHISTRPYSFLPIQMTVGRVSTESYDILIYLNNLMLDNPQLNSTQTCGMFVDKTNQLYARIRAYK